MCWILMTRRFYIIWVLVTRISTETFIIRNLLHIFNLQGCLMFLATQIFALLA